MQNHFFDENRKSIENDLENLKNKNSKILNRKNLYLDENFCGKLDFRYNDIKLKNKNKKHEKIEHTYFYKCEFKSIKFENCVFVGNMFLECFFENVTFINCEFYTDDCFFNIFKENTKFKNCIFENCNLQNTIFEDTSFENIKFQKVNMKNGILKKCEVTKMCFCDSDLRNFSIIKPYKMGVYFEDNYLSKFNEQTFIDKIDVDKKDKKECLNNYKIYRDIAIKFEENRLPHMYGRYYYLSKVIELKGLSGLEKLKSKIYWALCGYGEKPTYALITSLEIVLIFAILYMVMGIKVGENIICYKDILCLDVSSLNKDFMSSLYFSIVTFTTVGYGDITPINFSVFLSGIEMLLGVTMVGIWTATLARKITR